MSTPSLTVEDQVGRLRTMLGAANDSELANKLGVGRSAVSRWKERGVVPARYRYLVERNDGDLIGAATRFIAHDRIYSHPDNHYWMRAALEVLPRDYMNIRMSDAERAWALSRVVTSLMSAAADATVRVLGKARCENEEDYRALVRVLQGEYRERVQRVLSDPEIGRFETPQSAGSR